MKRLDHDLCTPALLVFPEKSFYLLYQGIYFALESPYAQYLCVEPNRGLETHKTQSLVKDIYLATTPAASPVSRVGIRNPPAKTKSPRG